MPSESSSKTHPAPGMIVKFAPVVSFGDTAEVTAGFRVVCVMPGDESVGSTVAIPDLVVLNEELVATETSVE